MNLNNVPGFYTSTYLVPCMLQPFELAVDNEHASRPELEVMDPWLVELTLSLLSYVVGLHGLHG